MVIPRPTSSIHPTVTILLSISGVPLAGRARMTLLAGLKPGKTRPRMFRGSGWLPTRRQRRLLRQSRIYWARRRDPSKIDQLPFARVDHDFDAPVRALSFDRAIRRGTEFRCAITARFDLRGTNSHRLD